MPAIENAQPEVSDEPVEKPCFYCSNSCVGLPRVKDRKGRYAHKACELALHKPSRKRRASKEPRRLTRPDFLDDVPDLTLSIYDTVAPCPTCHERVHPRAVLCTHCGTDLTGLSQPASMIEAKPIVQVAAPSLTSGSMWIVGVVTGAALGAMAWAFVAPQFEVQTSLAQSLLGASVGAAVIILGYLGRFLGPR